MEKMRMESVDMTAQNIEKIGAMFPNCITETVDENGKPKRAINFELLKQMLSSEVLEGDEAYEFTWVGKKAAIVEANKPIRKTLRPCPAESKDWDTTENLYIEGDNLEVLKLLQESYLGKVKMIYIDPPYNTGNDFIYRDDFAQSAEEYSEQMGMFDEETGDRLFRNTDSNGRFHSDWCSMIYSRLMLARNLLTDDGAIFISIDDREQENLKKICNEIFGEKNCVGVGQWRRVEGKPGKAISMARTSEFVLIYSKSIDDFIIGTLPLSEEGLKEFRYCDEKGKFRRGQIYYPNRGIHHYSVETPYGNVIEGDFTVKKETFEGYERDNKIYWAEHGEHTPYLKIYLSEFEGVTPTNTFGKEYGSSQFAVKEFKKLFDMSNMIFDNPKPTKLLERLLLIGNLKNDSIVLDFFSGSATTAHAIMKLNAKDGGHRKFIMVQLPEKCDEQSEAYKAGYKNICEIGKERIRRAGEKLKESLLEDGILMRKIHKQIDEQGTLEGFSYAEWEESPEVVNAKMKMADDLDIGFRVFKLADSNMKDVYYSADEYDQIMIAGMESNIKEDRSDLDLLFGCLLEWGLPLSLPYTSEVIDGCTVHTYNDGDLIACFQDDVPESVVKEIARRKPLRAVFRDSCFADSPSKINVFEIFKLYMPEDANDITKRIKVI